MALLTGSPGIRLCSLILLLAVGLAAGCDGGAVDVRDDLYAVHSLLVAGSDSVAVRVTRTDPRLPLGEEGLEGAEVLLVHAADTTVLDEMQYEPDEPGTAGPSGWYRATAPGLIHAGDTYQLVVDLPSGSARGQTRVPEPPQILSPQPELRAQVEEVSSIPVSLSAPGAGGAQLALRVEVLFSGDRQILDPVCRPARAEAEDVPPVPVSELSSFELRDILCRDDEQGAALEWDSLDVRLIAVVFDSAYVRYAKDVIGAGGVYAPYASEGITGAMGLFASVAEHSIPLRLIGPQAASQ